MKRSTIHILLILLFSNQSFSQSNNSYYNVFNSISASAISNHLNVLANDSLEGRAVGTMGAEIAANYISNFFSNLNLKRISKDNSYFQNIPMHGSNPLSGSELVFILDKDTMNLSFAEDYYLYRSGQQTFMPAFLPIVFVGYGIVAPEFDYNDYQSVDVEGKIVVYLDGEPISDDEEFFDGPLPTIYANPESKRRIAFARGCAGTIQIPISSYESWEDVNKDFQFEDVTLAYTVSGNLNIIINPDESDKLFFGSEYSFKDVIEMHDKQSIKSFDLKTKMRFRGVFKERDFISSNVIGMIEGSDPELKNTYLIISAHYDHLGIGESVKGDSIYNGALDNALGVSVMLELAKSFSSLESKPKRSIVFIATTGEEKGLLGSIYYTDNPLVPLYKTIANVNIDGIAMFKDFSSIVGIGMEYSTLDRSLNITTDNYSLELQDIPPQFRQVGAFNNSDQLAFAKAGIPSIIILEGTKNKSKSEAEVVEAFIDYYINRYHSPQDDINQNIDYKAAEKHTKVLF
nr:M28 family peptidase [Ignavibacterium sp.]